jgi:hypothetical protein
MPSIIDRLGDKYENLPDVLAQYETEFADITKHLKMKGKPLDEMLIEQASWVGHYQIRLAELKTLRKFFDTQIEKVRGKLWKHYTESYNRELNYRDKENYVNFDAGLVELKHWYHDISEMEDRYAAACEALQQKGFMLNAIVKAKTGGFDTIML